VSKETSDSDTGSNEPPPETNTPNEMSVMEQKPIVTPSMESSDHDEVIKHLNEPPL